MQKDKMFSVILAFLASKLIAFCIELWILGDKDLTVSVLNQTKDNQIK